MIPRTLKNQILIFLIPSIVLVLVLVGFIMYWASYHNILDHAKFDLLRLATKYENKVGSIDLKDSLTVAYIRKLQKAYSNGPFELVEVVGMDGERKLIFSETNLPILRIQNMSPETYSFLEMENRSTHSHFLYLVYPIQNHWFIWRESLSFVDHGLKEFQTILLIIIPLGCLFISIMLFWIIASRTRKFSEIITTVQTISTGSLQRRLPETPHQTEIDELIRSINQMLNRLEEGFDNINSFSANIAHELRTPLTIIGGEMELALREAHTDREKKLFENILEEVHYLTRVIKQMLLLSKLERGLVVPEQYEINLTEKIRNATERFKRMADEKNIAIDLLTSCQKTIFGDPTLIEEVYNIVFHNALKYSQPHSVISVKLKCESDYCHTLITDACGGLSPHECRHVFHPSVKVKPRDSRDGTGIGLSIASRIMELHHGLIYVDSDGNSGCTFHVKFPLAIYE